MSEAVDRASAIPNPPLYDFTVHEVYSIFLALYGGVYTSGLEHLDREGPYAMYMVHRSNVDSLAVSAAALEANGTYINMVAKKELMIPRRRLQDSTLEVSDFSVLGQVLLQGGVIPIDRDAAKINELTLNRIAGIVGLKGILGLFEGGEREFTGEEVVAKNIKLGALALAMKYGLGLLGVGVAGTQKGDSGIIHLAFREPFTIEQTEIDLNSPKDIIRKVRPIVGDVHAYLQEAQSAAYSERREHLARSPSARSVVEKHKQLRDGKAKVQQGLRYIHRTGSALAGSFPTDRAALRGLAARIHGTPRLS